MYPPQKPKSEMPLKPVVLETESGQLIKLDQSENKNPAPDHENDPNPSLRWIFSHLVALGWRRC
jgi:hypothetical protein